MESIYKWIFPLQFSLVLGLQLVFVPEAFRPKIKCGSACYTDDDVNFNNIGAVKIDTNGDITIYFPTVITQHVYIPP